MWFEAILGLRGNLDKSDLIPVGRVENVEELAKELGCKVGRLSSTHLGMPLGALFKSAAASDRIEETLQEIGYVETTIYFLGREDHLDS